MHDAAAVNSRKTWNIFHEDCKLQNVRAGWTAVKLLFIVIVPVVSTEHTDIGRKVIAKSTEQHLLSICRRLFDCVLPSLSPKYITHSYINLSMR